MNLPDHLESLLVENPRRKLQELMKMRRQRFGMRLNTFRCLTVAEIQKGAFELIEIYDKKKVKPFVLDDINAEFVVLLNVFQFLDLKDLLRAACVSKIWNFVANSQCLWKTVRLEGVKVVNVSGFHRALVKHKTSCLAIVLSSQDDQSSLWMDICRAVKNVRTLSMVFLDHAISVALTMLAKVAPQLTTLDSLHTQPGELDMAPIAKLTGLIELQVFGGGEGLELANIYCFRSMSSLKFLALSKVFSLSVVERHLPPGLVWLDLSPWSSLSIEMSTKTLPTLTNLWKLRLEHSHGCSKNLVALFDAISMMPNLYELELACFPANPGFDNLLSKCTNIKNFLYLTHFATKNSAAMNYRVLCGVSTLRRSLKYFVWEVPWDSDYSDEKSYDLDAVPMLDACHGSLLFLAPDHLWMILKNLLPNTEVFLLNVPFPYALCTDSDAKADNN